MKQETSFQIEFLRDLKEPIHKLTINSNIVSCITDNSLIRFRFDKADSLEEINLPLEKDVASNLFVDPTSAHSIITTKSNQTYYFSKLLNKFKLLKEAKDLVIECVGWNELNSNDNCTQNILIGTESGKLIETKLTANLGVDGYWKTITKFESKVTNILFGSYPDSNCTKYFLTVTTPNNIYPYFFNLGNISRSNMMFNTEFERINNQPEGSKCTTFPVSNGFSKMDCYFKRKSDFPVFLSWLMGVGVYNAPFVTSSTEAESSLFNRPKLLNFNYDGKHTSKPLSVTNTEFHVIILYSDSVDFICTINEESVQGLKLEDLDKLSSQSSFLTNQIAGMGLNSNKPSEGLLGIHKDRVYGTILVYTQKRIFKINYDQETKYLWKNLLELNNFDLALKYCNNDAEREFVRIKEAECLFLSQNYIQSAEIYAETSLAFEEVTLKFVELEDKTALRRYLLEYSLKRSPSRSSSANKNTYDVMCIWMLELLFDQINEDESCDYESSSKEDSSFKQKKITNAQLKMNNKEYKAFVEQPSVVASLERNKNMMYEKIRYYGDFYQTAIFAEIINDKEKILECLIESNETEEAIKLLKKERPSKLHYTYGKQMLKKHPNDIIEMWMNMTSKLDLKKVLYNLQSIPDTISKRFVKHLIFNQQCEVEEVHNLYVFQCARLAASTLKQSPKISQGHTDDLLFYLNAQGSDVFMTRYDPQLALRNCTEWANLEASVFLLSLMNKYQTAVELALEKRNLVLAKQIVSQFKGEDETLKNLWLQIARFIITETEKIEDVCELVRNQNVLKLEDVLPFLPDKVKIEHFSEAICASLDMYSSSIANIKKDMEVSTECSEKLKGDFQKMKQKPIVVPENSLCAYCSELLTIRPFCLFPCKHFFHVHCLEKVVISLLTDSSLKVAIDAKTSLIQDPDDAEAKKQYYNIISSDCCYCGNISIDNIDCQVINRTEFEAEKKLWMI